IIDRQHLPPGYGAGVSIDPSVGPIENLGPDLAARIGGVVGAAIDGTRVAFDGRTVRPALAFVLPEGGAAAVLAAPEWTMRLAGEAPAGAKTFTWSNAGAIGTYMLTIRAEGQEQASRQWIDGAAASVPFPLAAGIAPMSRGEVVRTYLKLGF